MAGYLIFPAFLGIALILRSRFEISPLITPFLTASGAVVFLFVGGLLVGLKVTLWALIAVGLVSLGTALPWLIQRLRAATYQDLWYAVLPLLAVIYCLAIPRDYRFQASDEYSHWAPSLKMLVLTNQLPASGSPLLYPHYPPAPGLALFPTATFFTFSEGLIALSQSCLVFFTILAALGLTRSRPLTIVLGSVGLFLSAYLLDLSPWSLMPDLWMGLIFGVCCVALMPRLQSRSSSVALASGMVLLPLIKETGILLLIVVTGIGLAQLLTQRSGLVLKRARMAYWLLLPGLASLILTLVWNFRLRREGLARDSIGEITRLLNSETLSTQVELVVSGLSGALLRPSYSGRVSVVVVITLFVLITFATLWFWARLDQQVVKWLALVSVGFLFYLGALLVLYIFFFVPYEAGSLASIERYLASYIIGWAVAVAASWCAYVTWLERSWTHPRRLWTTVALTAATSTLAAIVVLGPGLFRIDDETRKVRVWVDQIAAVAQPQLRPGDSYALVFQNSRGLEVLMTAYDLLPNRRASTCWSFGKPYVPGDVWTCNAESFSKTVGEPVLIVGRGDDQLWTEQRRFFQSNFAPLVSGVYVREPGASHKWVLRAPLPTGLAEFPSQTGN